MDELRQSILLTMELEGTRLHAQEELQARDQVIAHLKHLLAAAIRDKDEALQKYQKLMFEEDHRNAAFSSSDGDESIVSSPHHLPPPPAAADDEFPLLVTSPLPEKGKLLQAVMKAGPLLQTLLLAGPLPEWRHPPPPLDKYQIPPPPVVIPPETFGNIDKCGAVNRKRGLSEISHSAIDEMKYQRIMLQ